jgi:4-oxalocrotonate tautomerase family enzyme
MPRVTVHLLKGPSKDQKRLLIKEIFRATIEIFNVPEKASMVRFKEIEFGDFAVGEEFFSDIPPDNRAACSGEMNPFIVVLLKEGRTINQKRAFVKRVAEKTAQILEIPLKSVAIYIDENHIPVFKPDFS